MRPTALVAVAAPLLFAAGRAVPNFEPDPSWPKPLPNNWMLGQVSFGQRALKWAYQGGLR